MNSAISAFVVLSMLLVSTWPGRSADTGDRNPAMPKDDMAGMSGEAHAPAPVSTNLTLHLEGKDFTLSLDDLAAMPQSTVTAHNGHTNTDETYSGVPLGALLARYGLPFDPATRRKLLHSYLRVEGTDKYWVLYSVTEIEASEHQSDVLVATRLGGNPLGADGQFKLVDTADKKPERWVRNLRAITVMTAE